jgi:hypothetical protein
MESDTPLILPGKIPPQQVDDQTVNWIAAKEELHIQGLLSGLNFESSATEKYY